jgi:predicted HicB family RNase H-like nuclease
MAIAKKPGSKPPSDADADRFIARAGAAEAASQLKKARVPTMVRFDAELLEKIDAAAKRRGISRSAWIQYTLSEAVEKQRPIITDRWPA